MRDYYEIGKYGESAQGRPVKATAAGTCHVCDKRYRPGEKVIRLGQQTAVHPRCAYGT